jgi:hypothetical protein
MKQTKIICEFSDIIREKLTNKQFWNFVSSWFDPDLICDIMEDWDTETKKDCLKTLRKIIKKNKK